MNKVIVAAVALAGLGLSSVALADGAGKGKQSFGKPFTMNGAAMPIGDVLAKAASYEGKTVKVTGLVTQVCQAKGCWFEVAPAEKQKGVRIKSADYSIFVPKDCAGRTATIEGTFKVTTLTEAQAKHLAEDAAKAGQKAPEVKGPVQEFQLAATAVELN